MDDKNIRLRMVHPNGYKGVLYKDGTMDIYFHERPIYLAGTNKVSSADDLYQALEAMPKIMREIREQNDREFER